MLSPGDRFDRYSIEDLLGEGGMGRVYKAHDSRLHRRVALKILSVVASSSPELRSEGVARLIREARAAAVLDHPNTVAIHDVGEHDGVPYIAMELVVGRTLRAFVGVGDVPFETRLRWLVDVARALSAAHKAGIVHRDIKPENVMVRDDGMVKVLDFGVARRAYGELDVTGPTQGQEIPTITGKGVVIGTPVYMSPEQMRGVQVDGRSDQFGWGVLAYEMISGRRPWKDQADSLAMVATILSEPADALSAAAGWDVPAVVEKAIHKALRRTPAERFASMDEVVAQLEPLVRTSTPVVRPSRFDVEPRTPDSSDTRTTRRGVAASSPPNDGSTARSATRRRPRWIAIAIAAMAIIACVALWQNARRHRLATPTVNGKKPPISENNAAALAYEEGIQAMWDGASAASNRRLADAVAADPTLAAGHLRLCLGTFDADAAAARDHYRRAFEHRALLDGKDTALLDATEPFMREPPDLGEWEKRLLAASSRFPTDAEILYYLGYARQQRNNFESAADAYQRAAKADPHFALAWWSRGGVKYLQGDAPAALASYEDCLRMAPQATICLHERARVYRREGECEKMEAETRAAIAKEPDSALAYYYLAEALYSRGRPVDTVREALRQYVDKLPAPEKAERDLFYKASLANLSGDFVAAERFAREKEHLLEGKADRGDHFNVAALLADIYVESGRTDEAAAVANDYLNRQDLWIGFTNPLFFQNVLFRAGKLDLPTFEARRADWLRERDVEIKAKEEGKQGQARERAFPWIDGYADFVQTKEEAVAAIGLLPVYLPLPPSTRRNVGRETALGKVYALAGDADGAKFFLARATAHCGALDYPSPHTRAHFFLGMSREIAGDTPAACAAYAIVVSRWGDAKPRSVTATKAKDRMKVLGCK